MNQGNVKSVDYDPQQRQDQREFKQAVENGKQFTSAGPNNDLQPTTSSRTCAARA